MTLDAEFTRRIAARVDQIMREDRAAVEAMCAEAMSLQQFDMIDRLILVWQDDMTGPGIASRLPVAADPVLYAPAD